MKKTIYSALLWALLLVTAIFAGEITVSGKANVEGKGKDAKSAARSLALKNAEKKAVEEGIKLFLKDQAPNTKFASIKENILNNAGAYISEKLIVKDLLNSDKTIHLITIEANVDMNKISAEFKEAVSAAKSDMGNPSITFVLTTYEKKGTERVSSSSSTSNRDVKRYENESGGTSRNAESQSSDYDNRAYSSEQNSGGKNSSEQNRSDNSDSTGTSGKNSSASSNAREVSGSSERGSESQSVSASESGYKSQDRQNSGVETTTSSERRSSSFDERLWKKQSDATIIDAFQQEFKEKNFDLMATDKARSIALASSDVKLDVNPLDREAVRVAAEKEGANYVARGEVMILDVRPQSGSMKATVKLGVEIVDVNSGDIVASYSNTASAINTSGEEAIAQAIKKNGVLGARTLADQTLTTWSERSTAGQQYTVVLKNITSIRSQQRPFMLAVKESVANVANTTSPDEKTLIMKVTFKGKKDDLGWAILDIVGSKPGFEETAFDGPAFDGGTITFTFK